MDRSEGNPAGSCLTGWSLFVSLVLLCCGGCQTPARQLFPRFERESLESSSPWPHVGSTVQRAKRVLEQAESWEAEGDARSVDLYFQASILSWQAMAEQAVPVGSSTPAGTIYQASLRGLVQTAGRWGRLDGHRGLRVYLPDGPLDVPIENGGLAWPVHEFRKFHVAAPSLWPQLQRHYAIDGLGVPVVAIRSRPEVSEAGSIESFFPARSPVPATFLLCPGEATDSALTGTPGANFVLQMINPVTVDTVVVGQQTAPVARDLSAPFEYQLALQPNNPLAGFLNPSRVEEDGLRLLEPYQYGKIPVVFVHGLNSDPSVWAEMVNHLRAQPWFNQHYQVWGFNYATGSPFVTSALRLRQQLSAAVDQFDPGCQDPELRRMVLVGHSMGGLVSKLQVAESGEAMWRSISLVPLESLRATPEVKQELAERLYFSPLPFVQRVVYIATPHAGSALAARGIGRISSALVREDEARQRRHEALVRDNPQAFTYPFRRRIPTSIDLLEPSDPTLRAIYELQVSSQVRQHTILGMGGTPLTLRGSDGVVSVTSAGHPAAISEHHVAANHTGIVDQIDTIHEVVRILRLHLEDLPGETIP